MSTATASGARAASAAPARAGYASARTASHASPERSSSAAPIGTLQRWAGNGAVTALLHAPSTAPRDSEIRMTRDQSASEVLLSLLLSRVDGALIPTGPPQLLFRLSRVLLVGRFRVDVRRKAHEVEAVAHRPLVDDDLEPGVSERVLERT